MIKGELVSKMQRLIEERVPFVIATVVNASKPASVRPGDAALVLADGTIDGFVGGVCAQGSVRLYAARALESGDALLLRLVPGLAEGEDASQEGVVVSHNPCLSGGALEIFLEPQLAAPRIVVTGDTPIARALAAIATAAGYDVAHDEPQASDAALVIASHGSDEETALAQALQAGVGYVGLVASRKRGAAVLAALDVPDALRALVHTPAGLDIGARTPADIAISILAEIVATRTTHAPTPQTAIDPICGMEVVVSRATPQLDGVYFCCEGCRDKYAHTRLS
jgi:xanthine dehydrogenase accessory factor